MRRIVAAFQLVLLVEELLFFRDRLDVQVEVLLAVDRNLADLRRLDGLVRLKDRFASYKRPKPTLKDD